MSLNKVILMGRLTRDVEIRHTATGKAVGGFGIALEERWKDEAGAKQEKVTFVDVTAWEKTAEIIAQYFRQGDGICIEGKLQTDQWEDKATGKPMSKLKVVVTAFSFPIGRKSDKAKAAAPTAAPRPGAANSPGATTADDEIPF